MAPADRSRNLAYYHRNRDRLRREGEPKKAAARIRKFGVSVTWYLAQWAFQGGLCAICKQPETAKSNSSDRRKLLAVDHDHDTGAVRELLCQRCNIAISVGASVLRAGADYLDKHASST